MTKKRRKRALVAVALFSVVVGLLAYLALRENPDYVRAAKLLPAAQREAEAMFGPLTWAEWRADNGVSAEADLERWTEVAETVPETISSLWSFNPSPMTSREIFIAEREWYSRISSEIESLRFRHIMREDGEDWDFTNLYDGRDISRALRIGIIGAADDGNAEAVLEFGRALNKIYTELTVEPSSLIEFSASSSRMLLHQAVIRAAVRNRRDPAVIKSLLSVLDERPLLPTVRELMAADARGWHVYLEQLKSQEPAEIDAWLDEWGSIELKENIAGPVQNFLFEWLERLRGERPELNRNTGNRTVAALEARYWEVMVDYTKLFEDRIANKPGARDAILAKDESLLNIGDRSYEFAHEFYWSMFFGNQIRRLFNEQATRVVVLLVSRFPEYADLPAALPADLDFADPFGGDPILYRKTPTGFLIYTRYENEKDDGFPLMSPDQLGWEASFARCPGYEDWGVIVSYSPSELIP